MKKILLSLVFLVTGVAGIIPYWTGMVAEQQFEQFNQSVSPGVNLKLLESHYDRGWFNSQARAVFGTQNASESVSKEYHFTFVHHIDHGLLPLKATHIYSTLSTDEPVIRAELNEEAKETKLLESHSMLQGNGDVVSRVTMPALVFTDAENHAVLQWQNSQGQVNVKQSGALMRADLAVPQVKLETDKGQIIVQNLGLEIELQPGVTDLMTGKENLTVAELRLAGTHAPVAQLEGIKVEGNHQVSADNLTVAINLALQQIAIGKDYYGPGYGELELRHWHTASLSKIIKALVESRQQSGSSGQFNLVLLAMLMQYGVTLLNNAPEIAINRLSFETKEGKIQGELQARMEEFEARSWFNPWLLLNHLTAQIEMRLPEAILFNMTKAWLEWSSATEEHAVTQDSIKQRIQTWLTQGILTKTEDGYYSISMHLKKGILQSHGQQLPIATGWQ